VARSVAGEREEGMMKKTSKGWRIGIGVIALMAIAAGAVHCTGVLKFSGSTPPANALMVIAPYRYEGTWVFDDRTTGLKREPFVSGIPEMIDEMVRDIPNAGEGFRLLFSAQAFPGHTHKLTWRRGDSNGNWYYCEQLDMEGWLCPALLKYYPTPPKEIYVKAEEAKASRS
jgi:uncharacterized protein DUF6717